MNFKESIKYRETLIRKVYDGEKPAQDDRLWLLSNPIYNPIYEDEILKEDILNFTPNQEYEIEVKIKALNYHDGMFIPVIGVPVGKGDIKTEFRLLDLDEKEVKHQNTKMLAVMIDDKIKTAKFRFVSELGLMSILYKCEYYDPKMKVRIRANSDNPSRAFGMRKFWISDNEIEYRCKSPVELLSPFDAMVFSLIWTPIGNG